MTEAEWLSCGDPTPMLVFLRGKASDRKLRLFACACCRRVWSLLADGRGRNAVEVAELFADGEATWDQLKHANQAAETASEEAHASSHASADAWAAKLDLSPDDYVHGAWEGALYAAANIRAAADASATEIDEVDAAARATVRASVHHASPVLFTEDCVPDFSKREEAERACTAGQVDLLHDIFSNPFRPVATNPSWLTSDVRILAEGIYADRAFDRMVILADALQDAGCSQEDILNHCRQPGEHVRGCWVVDLLTGRK